MTDTAREPEQGSVTLRGLAPTPSVSNSPTIAIPCGSVVIAGIPALLQRWTVTAAATTTWTEI